MSIVKLCPNCGYNSLSKVAYSLNTEGKVIIHRKKGWKPNEKVMEWKEKKLEEESKRKKHQNPRRTKSNVFIIQNNQSLKECDELIQIVYVMLLKQIFLNFEYLLKIRSNASKILITIVQNSKELFLSFCNRRLNSHCLLLIINMRISFFSTFVFIIISIVAAGKQLFITYSRDYENELMSILLHGMKNEFYIDIGGFDPTFASIVLPFYEWHGFTIEASESRFRNFLFTRTEQPTLNFAMSNVTGETLTLYNLEDDSSSTVLKTVRQNDVYAKTRKTDNL